MHHQVDAVLRAGKGMFTFGNIDDFLLHVFARKAPAVPGL